MPFLKEWFMKYAQYLILWNYCSGVEQQIKNLSSFVTQYWRIRKAGGKATPKNQYTWRSRDQSKRRLRHRRHAIGKNWFKIVVLRHLFNGSLTPEDISWHRPWRSFATHVSYTARLHSIAWCYRLGDVRMLRSRVTLPLNAVNRCLLAFTLFQAAIKQRIRGSWQICAKRLDVCVCVCVFVGVCRSGHFGSSISVAEREIDLTQMESA